MAEACKQEERWTRVTIADSNDGEVSVLVRATDLSLSEIMDTVIVPALAGKGYGGIEEAFASHYVNR